MASGKQGASLINGGPINGVRTEAGVPLKVVSERLGHSSIRVTGDIYSHVRPEVDMAAAELVANLILGTA